VSEGFGIGPALNRLLDPVVTDRGSRFEGLGDLTRVESEVLSRLQLANEDSRRPHPGKTIGLEFHSNREVVGLTRALLLLLTHLVTDSKQRLNVVPYLVREYVGGSQVARGPELGGKLLEEVEVEVDAVVERAVVRSHPSVGSTTAGVGEAGEEHEFSVLILAPRLGKNVGPKSLVVVEDHRHEVSHFGLGICGRVKGVGCARARGSRLELVEYVLEAAPSPTAKDRKQDRDYYCYSAAAGPDRHTSPAATASTPAIDDVARPLGRLTKFDHSPIVPARPIP
jgi:hypothetical protein